MKPVPDKTPKGRRIRSNRTKESGALPLVPSNKFTGSMLTDAAKQTSKVVRNPAGWLCSLRLIPIKAAAAMAMAERSAISDHPIVVGIGLSRRGCFARIPATF